jgi:hypothetical protein
MSASSPTPELLFAHPFSDLFADHLRYICRYGVAAIVGSSSDRSGTGTSAAKLVCCTCTGTHTDSPPRIRADTGVSDAYYRTNLILLSLVLAILICMIAFFVYRLHSASLRKGGAWRKWQRFLLWDARVIGTLTLLDVSCAVAAYALYVGAECLPSRSALGVLSFVRLVSFMAVMAWMTLTAMMMQVIPVEGGDDIDLKTGDDGPSLENEEGAAQSSPSATRQQTRAQKICLMADLPKGSIFKKRGFVFALYLLFVVFLVVTVVLRFESMDQQGVSTIPPKQSCPADLLPSYNCGDNATADIIAYAIWAVVIAIFWVCYMVAVRRAWKGQKDLPNARYRLTKLFLRIQMRYGRLLFFAILFTGMIVELATIGTCRGKINSTLGSPPANLSLAVYACTLLYLFAPGTGRSDSIAMLKSIAWREDDVGGLLKELRTMEEGGESDVLQYMARQVGLGKLSNLVNIQEKVGRSVFCMEYCIKMFYFAWSAYKQTARGAFAAIGDTTYPFTVDKAMRVFVGLTLFKEIYDEKTDTYCIMLCSHDTIVLAFRGTSSRKNAMTDLKLMSIMYEPCNTLFGFPVLVHKGFWQAWNTVRRRIVDEVLAVANEGSLKRVFVTGHSLGGALACLCSVELQAAFNRLQGHDHGNAHPETDESFKEGEHTGTGKEDDTSIIEVHTYTFGAPRVGNVAFGTYANSLLSNYWHVVNTEDPVARIPKGFNYKRSGHRVLLGRNGNMEVYPSHFESSLFTTAGGKLADHLLRTYGVRLAQFLKAQFVQDLSTCDSEDEVNVVRQMAQKVELDSIGLDGLLGCFLGDLEDGAFDLTLLPHVSAASPAVDKVISPAVEAHTVSDKAESTIERRKESVDLELGAGVEQAKQAVLDEAEADIDFKEGLDDRVLRVLKDVWGE